MSLLEKMDLPQERDPTMRACRLATEPNENSCHARVSSRNPPNSEILLIDASLSLRAVPCSRLIRQPSPELLQIPQKIMTPKRTTSRDSVWTVESSPFHSMHTSSSRPRGWVGAVDRSRLRSQVQLTLPPLPHSPMHLGSMDRVRRTQRIR